MGKFFDFDFTILTKLPSLWAAVLHLVIAGLVSLQVILRKRDSGSAIAWLGVIWLSPFVGVSLYYVFGINRITRKATRLRPRNYVLQTLGDPRSLNGDSQQATHVNISERLIPYVDRLITRPLVEHNRVEVLGGGELAYPVMIAAIAGARSNITMSSYIFDRGTIARQFIAALAEAQTRGVQVRVLIDAVGAMYSIPRVHGLFRRAGLKQRYFLPVNFPWQFGATNLRNHRKLLIIDGAIGFTGGLNIRDRHDRRLVSPQKHVEDLHFRIEGAVVHQLQEVFADDWHFATGERLVGQPWYQHKFNTGGNSYCRAIADGPDEDFEKIKWVMLGAISKAVSRIWIVNPYFVPDTDLISALKIAGLSGLDVRILVPSNNNIPLVHWASLALFPGLLDSGVKVFLTNPPFDHSKLMIIDSDWSFIGSSNWDARSLRLNFELNVEIYDEDLNSGLSKLIANKQANSVQLNGRWVESRTFVERLRNNSARLLSPYL